jgi:predicted nucleotidyltransferase
MPSSTPPHPTVSDVAGLLEADARVCGMCLVGSHARGDHEPSSDVDLVVLTSERVATGELRDKIDDAGLAFPELSLLPQTCESFESAAARGSLFVVHARREGQVLLDRGDCLRRAFDSADRVPADVGGEIRRRVRHLRHYRNLSRFNGNLLFVLSTTYGAGKGVAIALTAELGCLTFVKEDALNRVAECRPEVADDVRTIARLRPFYDLARDRASEADLPFDYHGAEREAKDAVEAVLRLAGQYAEHG